MKKCRIKGISAFTLVELLVVVLIIGVLTAVAVPQYQKAVKKAKYAKMLAWVRTAAEAQKLYYLRTGTYTTSFDELGLQTSSKKCGAWLQGGPLWKIDGICIGVVNAPVAGTIWGSLADGYASDWNGYAFLPKVYRGVPAGVVVCVESRNPGSEDPHCTGRQLHHDAYGTFYAVE